MKVWKGQWVFSSLRHSMEGPINSWWICSKKIWKTVYFIPFLQRSGIGEPGHRLYTSLKISLSVSITGKIELWRRLQPVFNVPVVKMLLLYWHLWEFLQKQKWSVNCSRDSKAAEYIILWGGCLVSRKVLWFRIYMTSLIYLVILSCARVGMDDIFWPEWLDLDHIVVFLIPMPLLVSMLF